MGVEAFAVLSDSSTDILLRTVRNRRKLFKKFLLLSGRVFMRTISMVRSLSLPQTEIASRRMTFRKKGRYNMHLEQH